MTSLDLEDFTITSKKPKSFLAADRLMTALLIAGCAPLLMLTRSFWGLSILPAILFYWVFAAAALYGLIFAVAFIGHRPLSHALEDQWLVMGQFLQNPGLLILPAASLAASILPVMLPATHRQHANSAGRSWPLFLLPVDAQRDATLDFLLLGALAVGLFQNPDAVAPLLPQFDDPDRARMWIGLNVVSSALFLLAVRANHGALPGWPPGPKPEAQPRRRPRRLKAPLARVLRRRAKREGLSAIFSRRPASLSQLTRNGS